MFARYYLCISLSIIAVFLVLVMYFIATDPQPQVDEVTTSTRYDSSRVEGSIQPIPTRVHYDDKWARLGKALFNSTLLSGDNTISCASCHMADFGGDDGFPVSTGVNNNIGFRNSPTVLNAVFNFRQFWDGRSENLADQVSVPVHNPLEMNSNWPEVVAKLEQKEEFRRAFSEVTDAGITEQAIVKAITVYEETLITPNAPIDRFLLGDTDAISEQQKRGLEKFNRLGCVTCHQGRNIGGNLYQRIGRIDQVPAFLLNDLGLFVITQNPADKHVFKVPSLRNVVDTAPYFHNGSVNTLREAVRIMAKGQLGMELSDEDLSDLLALLQSFSAPAVIIN